MLFRSGGSLPRNSSGGASRGNGGGIRTVGQQSMPTTNRPVVKAVNIIGNVMNATYEDAHRYADVSTAWDNRAKAFTVYGYAYNKDERDLKARFRSTNEKFGSAKDAKEHMENFAGITLDSASDIVGKLTTAQAEESRKGRRIGNW